MRQILGSAVFLAIACPLVADDKTDAVKKLNGTYELISFIGGPKKEDKKESGTFTFKDGTVSIMEGGKKKDQNATFTVDASKKPAHIDIKPEKGMIGPVLGIYEMKETDKGTELTLAFVYDGGGTRPKDFKGEGKDEVVMKLLKKKEK